MKILVLDDDIAFVEMLRAALTEEGHRVTAATDGRAGLELARRSDPDVILLDVLMPGMDGRAFAFAYARREGPHAPIVVVSGASAADAHAVPGAAAVVAKPFDLDDLTSVLREVSARA